MDGWRKDVAVFMGNADGRLRSGDFVRLRGSHALLVPLSGVQAEIRPRRDGALATRRPDGQRPSVQSRQLRHPLTEAALEAVPREPVPGKHDSGREGERERWPRTCPAHSGTATGPWRRTCIRRAMKRLSGLEGKRRRSGKVKGWWGLTLVRPSRPDRPDRVCHHLDSNIKRQNMAVRAADIYIYGTWRRGKPFHTADGIR